MPRRRTGGADFDTLARPEFVGRDEARLEALADELGGPQIALGVRCDGAFDLPLLIESRGHLLLMGSVVGRVPIPGSFFPRPSGRSPE